MVLNSGARTLAHRSVAVTVHPAPAASAAPAAKAAWTDAELVEQAGQIIAKELRQMLERDVVERLVGVRYRRLAADQKARRASKARAGAGAGAGAGTGVEEERPPLLVINSLKGLSFKKQNKRVREEAKAAAAAAAVEAEVTLQAEKAEEEEEAEAEVVMERPKKKRKKEVVRKVAVEVESEDEDMGLAAVEDRKRGVSWDHEDEEPTRKRPRIDHAAEEALDVVPVAALKADKKKASSKKGARKAKAAVEEPVDQVTYPDDMAYAAPQVAQLHVTPGSSLSPPSSPLRASRPPESAPRAVDPFEQGVCADDEDMYFARLALAESMGHEPPTRRRPAPTREREHEPDALPPFRVHATGSARTEGYYKISHAEKSAYVAQYASRSAAADAIEEQPAQQPKPAMMSSRSNRANARRQAQGLEEINQVQRAMALSKGETAAAELSIKFNQLQTRKKHLRFARSPIHDWGLYAMERIARGEMVIEYVGEVIRAQVADKREKAYERQGIGSSYLFRIDEDLVVDATKKGNLG